MVGPTLAEDRQAIKPSSLRVACCVPAGRSFFCAKPSTVWWLGARRARISHSPFWASNPKSYFVAQSLSATWDIKMEFSDYAQGGRNGGSIEKRIH